jgi:hypothetical protein
MGFSISRRVRVLALAAVGAAVVAGGVAYATIPDGGGVIHGCYQRSSGSLRVIDTGTGGACSSQERSLDWSQTGPTGATGATGPAGPSDVWAASNPYTPSVAGNPNQGDIGQWTLTTMTSVSLPAGSFYVAAKTSLLDTQTAVNLYCTLRTSTATVDDSYFFAPTDEYAPTMLEGVVTLANPDTVALRCGSSSTDSAGIVSKVDAIPRTRRGGPGTPCGAGRTWACPWRDTGPA